MIDIFEKNLNIKDYQCSMDNKHYPKLTKPRINLYVQIISKCNAKCDFCNVDCINEDFNYDKFEEILQTLTNNIEIAKIAITGGEPLLNVSKTKKVISIAKKFCNYVTVNTNGFSLENLTQIYPLVNQIDISRHHYLEKIHSNILKLDVASLSDLSNIDIDRKITINCVIQKGLIDSYSEVIKFLDCISKYNFKVVKFISLLPLTSNAKINYVDPSYIINQCKKFTNSGMLYDHDMCNCFEFLYLSDSGNIVKTIIRNTTNSCYTCIKQLVFNGSYLFDGFKKNNIIF